MMMLYNAEFVLSTIWVSSLRRVVDWSLLSVNVVCITGLHATSIKWEPLDSQLVRIRSHTSK